MKLIISLSALKPSQYREFVKEWDRGRYKELFKKFTNDPKAFRIYLPMKTPTAPVKAGAKLQQYISRKGYVVDDYVAGYAVDKKDPKRRVRIGKLLDDPEIKKSFEGDPKRQAHKGSMMVVISRHPYDIAGMSTGRGWTSCQDLEEGSLSEYVGSEIQAGSLIAYLVDEKDPNIKNPKSRLLIKKFEIQQTGKEMFVVSHVYGTANPQFKKIVDNWAKPLNKEALAEVKGITKTRPVEGTYPDKMRVTVMGKKFASDLKSTAGSWKGLEDKIDADTSVGFNAALHGKTLKEVAESEELLDLFLDLDVLSPPRLSEVFKAMKRTMQKQFALHIFKTTADPTKYGYIVGVINSHVKAGNLKISISMKELLSGRSKVKKIIMVVDALREVALGRNAVSIYSQADVRKTYISMLEANPDLARTEIPGKTLRKFQFRLSELILDGFIKLKNQERNKIFPALIQVLGIIQESDGDEEIYEDMVNPLGLTPHNVQLLNAYLAANRSKLSPLDTVLQGVQSGKIEPYVLEEFMDDRPKATTEFLHSMSTAYRSDPKAARSIILKLKEIGTLWYSRLLNWAPSLIAPYEESMISPALLKDLVATGALPQDCPTDGIGLFVYMQAKLELSLGRPDLFYKAYLKTPELLSVFENLTRPNAKGLKLIRKSLGTTYDRMPEAVKQTELYKQL